jgi:opacity protein-like surface antigen
MVKAEYLFMDLGSIRTDFGSMPPPVGSFNNPTATVRADFTDQIFRIGVSYKFNEPYAPLK